MNNILESNLKVIGKYNKKLVEKISALTSLQNNLSLCETVLKEPNLTYNTVPIHSQNGAEIEAQNIVKNSDDSLNYIHVIYGLGLGYLFKEFCDNAAGAVVLYEPDIEVLRVTLEIVDFTKELSRSRVFVVSDLDSLEKLLYEIYTFSSKVKCHFLDYHRNSNYSELQALANELTRLNSILANNFNFQKTNNFKFLTSSLTAFREKAEATPLHLLKDSFKDIPAIIVSAGPSLNKNIEVLKENQDKAIIFCVGTAFKALKKHGIKPDFLNAIEMYDCTTQFSEYNLEDINFISESYTNAKFYDLKYKKKFLTMSRENVANIWFGAVTNNDISDYETKGTVSYNSLSSAQILGCNPIIMIGQDLAYTDGECYSRDSAYGSLECTIDPETKSPKIVPKDREKYRIAVFGENSTTPVERQNNYIDRRLNELNSALTSVKGQNNDILATEQGYALFIEYFKDFAKRHKDNRLLVNCSTGGAQIDGFFNLKLADVMSQIQGNKPDIDEVLNKISYRPDYKKISDNLTNEINLISEVLNELKHGQVDLKNYKRELQRSKILNRSGSKYFRNCLESFSKIVGDYNARSEIVYATTRNEEATLGWLLKEKDGVIDYNTQMEIIKAFEEYFYNNEKKFLDTKEKLAIITTEIQSMIQSLI